MRPEDYASYARAKASPAAFRAELVVAGACGQAKLGDIAAAFQQRDFAQLDPAFVALASGARPPVTRAWLERVKGSSKTSDVTCLALWLLAFAQRPVCALAGAADQDQAAEVLKVARSLLRLNPWLSELLTVQASAIVNERTGSRLDVIASDAPSAHGSRPDLVILDEVVHHKGQDFALTCLDNASKVPGGLVVIATNAGTLGTWQWRLREDCRQSPRWYFSAVNAAPPWLDREELAEARRRNPPSRFARLWEGRWSSGEGDAISEADLEAALTQAGPLAPGQPGWLFAAGLDLGLKRDASALVVVGLNVGWQEESEDEQPALPPALAALIDLGQLEGVPTRAEVQSHPGTGRLQLALVKVWRPEGGQVSLEAIEREVLAVHRAYGLGSMLADAWQAALLVERLQRQGVPAAGIQLTPPVQRAMAAAVLEEFTARNLDLYPDDDLLADLRAVRAVEKTYGVRLESPRTAGGGHGDAATALSLALYASRGGRAATVQGELVCWPA
jgi:hypothetical protein